nr:PLP-dependent transferase [Mediterraneibacter gnavus]
MTENQDLLAMTHVGEDPKKYMGAVTPPVFMNSLHVFDTVKDYFDVDIFNDEYYYGRASNPTVTILEKKTGGIGTRKQSCCVFSRNGSMRSGDFSCM